VRFFKIFRGFDGGGGKRGGFRSLVTTSIAKKKRGETPHTEGERGGGSANLPQLLLRALRDLKKTKKRPSQFITCCPRKKKEKEKADFRVGPGAGNSKTEKRRRSRPPEKAEKKTAHFSKGKKKGRTALCPCLQTEFRSSGKAHKKGGLRTVYRFLEDGRKERSLKGKNDTRLRG